MIDKNKHILNHSANIKDGLVRINELDGSAVFISDENEIILGAVTDGDIRRGILNDIALNDSITKVMHSQFRHIKSKNYTIESINEFRKQNINIVPIIDENGRMVKLIDLSTLRSVLPIEVLLMAGGRGERLRPLTDSIPKPMLKIGDKPILEHNIDRLALYGIEKIAISVKYKAEIIESHFGDGSDKGLNISYIYENEPLGTIGAIKNIPSINTESVLVMNSDLLTNIDFEDFYLFFKDKNADMLVASIPYRVDIPYGVLETVGDSIVSLKEKPTYTYYSNAGIYLIKTNSLDKIPKDKLYNATDLMDQLMKDGKNVINYPIVQYWLDIGKHDDFRKAQEDIKHITF